MASVGVCVTAESPESRADGEKAEGPHLLHRLGGGTGAEWPHLSAVKSTPTPPTHPPPTFLSFFHLNRLSHLSLGGSQRHDGRAERGQIQPLRRNWESC